MLKRILIVTLCFAVFVSCGKSDGQRLLASSSGNVNNLSVVIDNELWEGTVGETIRNILAAPVYGLPQEEPMFDMSQMPPHVFSGFATVNRTVLKIEKGEANTKFLKDAFAKPQKLVVVSGETIAEIKAELEKNADRIVTTFRNSELNEVRNRIQISPNKSKNIEDALGLSIEFPSVYRIAKEDNGFFWVRKDTKNGYMNLLLYTLPLDAMAFDNDSLVKEVIKMRDSIGKKHIPGPVDGSYMITELAYTPFIGNTIIDNKPAIVTKSTWEVENAFMAGPFINYIIEDKLNNRLVVAEGFTYAPSAAKRDQMFELEAIIKSMNIK